VRAKDGIRYCSQTTADGDLVSRSVSWTRRLHTPSTSLLGPVRLDGANRFAKKLVVNVPNLRQIWLNKTDDKARYLPAKVSTVTKCR
jgi:hypothetical protein